MDEIHDNDDDDNSWNTLVKVSVNTVEFSELDII